MNYNIFKILCEIIKLWFDVEIEWITTGHAVQDKGGELWFDVEIEWITTYVWAKDKTGSCGLM